MQLFKLLALVNGKQSQKSGISKNARAKNCCVISRQVQQVYTWNNCLEMIVGKLADFGEHFINGCEMLGMAGMQVMGLDMIPHQSVDRIFVFTLVFKSATFLCMNCANNSHCKSFVNAPLVSFLSFLRQQMTEVWSCLTAWHNTSTCQTSKTQWFCRELAARLAKGHWDHCRWHWSFSFRTWRWSFK